MARGLPGNESYTNVYQTGRDGRVGGRVGSAAPLGRGRTVLESAADQTFATCNGTEAALPLAMVLTLTRGLFGSTSASDTFLEHWITSNIQPVVPAPRWFRQGNIPWHGEASLAGLYSPNTMEGLIWNPPLEGPC